MANFFNEFQLPNSPLPDNRQTPRALGDYYTLLINKLVAGETLSVTVFGNTEQDLSTRVTNVLDNYNTALAKSKSGLKVSLTGDTIDERDNVCTARTVSVYALPISDTGSRADASNRSDLSCLQRTNFEAAQLEAFAWYRAIVPAGHVGAGKARDMVVYINAPDTVTALEILDDVGGWKRRRIPFILDKMAQGAAEQLLSALSKSPPKSARYWLKRGFIKEEELSEPLERITGNNPPKQTDN